MTGPAARAPIRAIILADRPAWISAAHRAAIWSGATIDEAGSAADAVHALIVARPAYTHVLLQPACAGASLADLVGLTAGETASAIALLLLGEGHELARHARVIPRPSGASLSRALTAAPPLPDPPLPDLAPAELRDAIAHDMLRTHYQPIVRLADAVPTAVEVLARLEHPERGVLSPDRFVPLFEDAGLAPDLTRAVAARAIGDIGAPGAPGSGLKLALNFPLDVVLLPDAMAILDDQRVAVGLDASRIVIELTESRPVRDLAALRGALDRLRGIGYGVAIDDIAPGIALGRALLDLPFTAVKLDWGVVQGAATSRDLLDFIDSVIATAKRRGMTVVAEGIEDRATWTRMAALGVDFGQGFLIGRPLPASALKLWLQAWTGSGVGARPHTPV